MTDLRLEETGCFCGARETLAAEIRAKDLTSGEFFTYRRCASCGTQRLSPRPPGEAIGAYYTDSYAPHAARPDTLAARVKRLVYLAYYAPANRLGLLRPLLRVLLYPMRGHTVFAFHEVPPKRMFEFGAAAGNDLMLFRAEGWDVAGCEPSAHACAVAEERGVMLQNVAAEAAELSPQSVSCIVINNVLEHTHAPKAVLAACWRGLAPGGSLVIIVPNHASLTARLFGAAWPGYDAPRHLWGFTPRALSAGLCRVGFPTPAIYHLFPGRWVWLSTLHAGRTGVPVAAWRRRMANALSLLLLPVGFVAALFGRGDFMTVVATKPMAAA